MIKLERSNNTLTLLERKCERLERYYNFNMIKLERSNNTLTLLER